MKVMTAQELSGLLGQVGVIDVNEADNYAFAHVPGPRLLAYDAVTPEVLPADRSGKLVFCCWSPECPAAAIAAHRVRCAITEPSLALGVQQRDVCYAEHEQKG